MCLVLRWQIVLSHGELLFNNSLKLYSIYIISFSLQVPYIPLTRYALYLLLRSLYLEKKHTLESTCLNPQQLWADDWNECFPRTTSFKNLKNKGQLYTYIKFKDDRNCTSFNYKKHFQHAKSSKVHGIDLERKFQLNLNTKHSRGLKNCLLLHKMAILTKFADIYFSDKSFCLWIQAYNKPTSRYLKRFIKGSFTDFVQKLFSKIISSKRLE